MLVNYSPVPVSWQTGTTLFDKLLYHGGNTIFLKKSLVKIYSTEKQELSTKSEQKSWTAACLLFSK
jgi:hypothetical protein